MSETVVPILPVACEPCRRNRNTGDGADLGIAAKWLLFSAAEKAADQAGQSLHDLTREEFGKILEPKSQEIGLFYANASQCGRMISGNHCSLWTYDEESHTVVSR